MVDNRNSFVFPRDEDFPAILERVISAIKYGLEPKMSGSGSSGSYLLASPECPNHVLAIFKPKSEEPYGEQNPRWTKWLQRCSANALALISHPFANNNLTTNFPSQHVKMKSRNWRGGRPCWMFGRSCLLPNSGWTSEVGACVVDRALGLGIVPKTDIVFLSSPALHYGFWARRQVECRLEALHSLQSEQEDATTDESSIYPTKCGSMQLYVEGMEESLPFLCKRPHLLDPKKSDIFPESLRLEFEKLVILDYLIRNTDRTFDN